MFDQLFVTGDLIAPGPIDIVLSFLDGFAPQEGDIFELLSVGGSAPILDMAEGVAVTLLGLPSGTDFALDFSSDGISGRVVTGPTSVIPLPATLPMLLAAFGGLALLRRRA